MKGTMETRLESRKRWNVHLPGCCSEDNYLLHHCNCKTLSKQIAYELPRLDARQITAVLRLIRNKAAARIERIKKYVTANNPEED